MTNWGDVASGTGLVVSLVGLIWVFIEARSARSASQAAELASDAARQAANEAKEQIHQQLQAVDLVRAIEFIQRIKTLHDSERWETTMELYQPLRNMLSDIIVRCPDNQAVFRGQLSTARATVLETETVVRERVSRAISDQDQSRLNQNLNNIQSCLEEMASNIAYGDSQWETR